MRAVRALVQGLGELCITVGLLLLLFVAWQLWWTDVESDRAQLASTRGLEQTWQRELRAPSTTVKPAVRKVKDVPMGDAFALIRVPRFGADYVRPIVAGTELSVLEDGVGHYRDTAGPGEVGNFSLAGHRVTYGKPFNRIAELQPGDPIVIETRTTWYVYRMVSHSIVSPLQVDVVAPVPNRPGVVPTQPMMTMTACHPKFSARQRYVVFSQLAQTIAKTAGGAVPDVLTAAAQR